MSFQLTVSGKNKRQRDRRLLKGYYHGSNCDMVNNIMIDGEFCKVWDECKMQPQYDVYYASIHVSGSKSSMNFTIEFEACTLNILMTQINSALNMLRGLKNE